MATVSARIFIQGVCHAFGHPSTHHAHAAPADRDHSFQHRKRSSAHRTLTIGMSGQVIKIISKQLSGPDSSLPQLAMQIICLVDSYMIWVGTTSDSQVEGGAELAPLQGHLARDWACAMPPVFEGGPTTASALFRSADSDAAFSMSQRLAKRFKKQIFLSVDVPPEVYSAGRGPAVLLEAEKGVVEQLRGL